MLKEQNGYKLSMLTAKIKPVDVLRNFGQLRGTRMRKKMASSDM